MALILRNGGSQSPDRWLRESQNNHLKRTAARIFGCIFFFSIAVLVYALLYKVIGISHTISVILTIIAYALFAFASAYAGD